jgi:hypothetical protein
MEIGVLVHWGRVIPGKEEAAVDAFAQTTKLYGEKLANGTFTYFEPFMYRTGDWQEDLGFFVLKGPEEKVIAFFDSMEAKTLRTKVAQMVDHLKIEYLYTGPDVLEQVAILGKLAEKTPALVR